MDQRYGLLGGWPTGRLIDLDAKVPGVISRVLTSGPARRQAVFAILAAELAAERHQQVIGDGPDEGTSLRRAEVIRHGSASDILAELLGTAPPQGLSGALERIGLTPMLQPALYHRLIKIFIDPGQRPVVEALRYVGKITPSMLRSIDLLPGCLLHANVLKKLDGSFEAHQFAEGLAFAKSVNTNLTDEAIFEAASRMRDNMRLDELLSRFIRRADLRLAAPIPADREIRPLQSVRDMIGAGRQFRNCLHTNRKIVNALRGKAAYAVYGQDDAILEFACLSTGEWLFVAAYGHRNAAVPPAVEQAIFAKAKQAGIAYLPPSEGGHGTIGGLLQPYDPIFLEAA